MKTVTLKLSDRKYIEIKNFYAPYFVNKKGEYLDFFAKLKKVNVTGYVDKKEGKKIVFAGEDAEHEASIWSKDALKVKLGKEYEVDNSSSKKEDKKSTSKKVDEKVAKEKKALEKIAAKKEATKKENKKATSTKKSEPKAKKVTKEVAKKETKTTTTKKAVEKKVTEKEVVEKKATTKKEVKKDVTSEFKKEPPKKTTTKTKTIKSSWLDLSNQIGSDEVGVGDFLGPIVVVACYIKKSNIAYLDQLGVKDSKKLTDEKIREIAPLLAKKVEFSKLTLSNEKYNSLVFQSENLNSIKAKMHNRALLNMSEKHPEVKSIFIDQFVEEKKYYEYLNDANERQVKNIIFKTKGETYYPCVAAASILARYSFLLEMDALSAFYRMDIPFGASSKVDDFAKEFIAKYGIAQFNKIAKMNFANYKKAIMG